MICVIYTQVLSLFPPEYSASRGNIFLVCGRQKDEPLVHAIALNPPDRKSTSSLVQDIVSRNTNDVTLARKVLQDSVAISSASRPNSHRKLKLDLSTHEVCTKRYVSNEL